MVPPVTKTWNVVVGGRRRRTEGRAQMLALGGILFLLGAAETSREMADTEPGGSAASDLGFSLAESVCEMYIVAGEALVMGGLIYLWSYLRGRGVTLLGAIFNWAVVVGAAVLALLMYVE